MQEPSTKPSRTECDAEPSFEDLSARFLNAIRTHQNASDMVDHAVANLLGINLTDARCLDIIDRLGTTTPGELSQESGLSGPAITAVLDRMEGAGFVERARDAKDRRKVHVTVSATTREMSALIYGHMSALGQQRMGGLSAEQVRLIISFLEVSTGMSRTLAAIIAENAPPKGASMSTRIASARIIDRELADVVANISPHQNS